MNSPVENLDRNVPSGGAVRPRKLNVELDPSRSLHRRYALALTVIAILLLVQQLIVQPAISRLTTDAPVINVSGRQRMLSQRLSKGALALVTLADRGLAAERHNELSATLTEWERAHRALRDGDRSRGIPGLSKREELLHQKFDALDAHVEGMGNAARALLDMPIDLGDLTTAGAPYVSTILEHEPRFLETMHEVVGLFEAKARQHVAELQATSWSICLGIVAMLVLIELWVVRPSIKGVQRYVKRQAHRYEVLVEAMTDGLMMHDMQGTVLFANTRFAEMVGVPADQLAGRPISTLLADSDQRRYSAFLRQPASETLKPREVAWIHPVRGMIETRVSPSSIVLDRPNHPEQPAMVVVLTDLTDRKQTEARSRLLLSELAQAAQLKSAGVMAAGIAHEMHQPLCAIVNFAEACLAQLDQPEVDAQELRPPLGRICKAALRAGEITRRMRTYAGRRPATGSEHDLNALLVEVEQLMLPEARMRSISIETRMAENLPLIRLDSLQIQQVLTNLIQNAFDALKDVPAYRRRVMISTRRDGDETICITVCDSGPGIPDELRDEVYQPFFTTKTTGTGLGLSICQTIVGSHGGTMTIGRSPDGGAAISCRLPVAGAPIETLSLTESGTSLSIAGQL